MGKNKSFSRAKVSKPIPQYEIPNRLPGDILIVKVGNEDRPAGPDDIKDVTKAIGRVAQVQDRQRREGGPQVVRRMKTTKRRGKMTRVEILENKVLELEKKLDLLVDYTAFEYYSPSEIIEKTTRAYVEVRGKPGRETVWYSNGTRMVQAKTAKYASKKAGYVVASVPIEAVDKTPEILVESAAHAVPAKFSTVIDRSGPALIRVRGKKIEYMRGGKWVSGPLSQAGPQHLHCALLDKRKIAKAKPIKVVEGEDWGDDHEEQMRRRKIGADTDRTLKALKAKRIWR